MAFIILDLNHEGASATLEVLEAMLVAIKARGYEFVTLQECLQLDELLPPNPHML